MDFHRSKDLTMTYMQTETYDSSNKGIVDASQGIDLIFNADETIVAYNCVGFNEFKRVINSNWPDPVNVANVIGIALNNANPGQPVRVRVIGLVTNPVWALIPLAPVFAYTTGRITQDILEKSILRIGKAVTSDTIFLMPSEFYRLS